MKSFTLSNLFKGQPGGVSMDHTSRTADLKKHVNKYTSILCTRMFTEGNWTGAKSTTDWIYSHNTTAIRNIWCGTYHPETRITQVSALSFTLSRASHLYLPPVGASSWLDPFLDRLQILSSRDSLNSLPKWPWSYFQGLSRPSDLLRTDRVTRMLASKSKGWPRVICLQVGWASMCVRKRPLVTQDESGLKERERVDYGMSLFLFLSQSPQTLGLVLDG